MNAFLQALLRCKTVYTHIKHKHHGPLHTILHKIISRSDILDSKDIFTELKNNIAFNKFNLNEKADALTFGDTFLTQLYHECRINCDYNNVDTIIFRYTKINKLKCGHNYRKKEMCYMFMIKLCDDLDIQQNINKIFRFSRVRNSEIMCFKCKKISSIKLSKYIIYKSPQNIFLEIERGYKEKNHIKFINQSIIISKDIKIGKYEYGIQSAILYENEHYTFVYEYDKKYYIIDNSKKKVLTSKKYMDKIKKYSRCIILNKKAKQKYNQKNKL